MFSGVTMSLFLLRQMGFLHLTIFYLELFIYKRSGLANSVFLPSVSEGYYPHMVD